MTVVTHLYGTELSTDNQGHDIPTHFLTITVA